MFSVVASCGDSGTSSTLDKKADFSLSVIGNVTAIYVDKLVRFPYV